jgi:hypothetical protein
MLPTVVLAFNKPVDLAPSAPVVDFGDFVDNTSTACVILRTSRMTIDPSQAGCSAHPCQPRQDGVQLGVDEMFRGGKRKEA